MKMFTVLISFFVSIQLIAQAPILEWVVQPSGTSSEQGVDITTDQMGNIYVVGHFKGIVDFDPSPSTLNLTTATNDLQVFIAKYDTEGQIVWAKSIDDSADFFQLGISVNSQNEVYITGRFSATVDFDLGDAVHELTAIGNRDAFVLKLASDGSYIWAKNLGGESTVAGIDITVDNDGNVYTTGCYRKEADFDPGPGTYHLDAGSYSGDYGDIYYRSDLYISKLDHNGDFLWAKSVGYSRSECGLGISTDDFNNVYVIGEFYRSNSRVDLYVAKLTPDGNFLWEKQIGRTGGSLDVRAHDIDIDVDGNVYVTGGFEGEIDFDPGLDTSYLVSEGLYDIYILKLDSTGNYKWAKSFGAAQTDIGQSLTLDQHANIYLTGTFDEEVDFDPGPDTFLLSNPIDEGEIFTLKLNKNGSFIWAGSFEGNEGSADKSVGHSIALDLQDNIYTTGVFTGTTDFAPDTTTFSLTVNGPYDAFIHKMSQTCNYALEILSADHFTLPNGEYTICPTDSITLEVVSDSGVDVMSYTWNSNDTTATIQVAPDSATTFSVTVTYSNGCTNVASTIVHITDGMVEIPYNNIDDDCDETTLDDDLDQDGFVHSEDCDDNNPMVNSDAIEIPYNGIDDDCDESTLDDDLDQDGFNLAFDCDDTNPMVNPFAVEIPYNGLDDDCDELTLDDDLDQDGFLQSEDCDDDNPLVNDDALEIPYNGLDDDCDETTLDDDIDQDGFVLSDDCNDSNPLINPDAPEIPYNGINDDCDEETLDDDLDQDGFLLADDCDDNNPDININAVEIPNNGIDENCDGNDFIVSVTDLNDMEVQVFPNPTTGVLHIALPQMGQGVYELLGTNGKLISHSTFQKETTVYISDYPQGVYYLLIKTEDLIWTKRVIRI